MQLSKTCKPDTELVITRPNQDELALVNDGLDSRLSCRDKGLEYRIDKGTDRLALTGRCYGDEWSLPPTRLNADEHATGHYVLPGSLEGMDHALGCDSSKGPAEESDVEAGVAYAQSFG